MNVLYLRDESRRDTISYKIQIFEEKIEGSCQQLVATIDTYE